MELNDAQQWAIDDLRAHSPGTQLIGGGNDPVIVIVPKYTPMVGTILPNGRIEWR